MVASPISSVPTSSRLKKAQLRLAEAQGIIPIGASEDASYQFDYNSTPSLSRVREINWRVAEPAVRYDPVAASKKLYQQPVKWLIRNIQFLLPVALFFSAVIIDILTNKEEDNRLKRADQLLDLISAQSPALIKAGQALASRSDLLPKEYLNSLQKVTPYHTQNSVYYTLVLSMSLTTHSVLAISFKTAVLPILPVRLSSCSSQSWAAPSVRFWTWTALSRSQRRVLDKCTRVVLNQSKCLPYLSYTYTSTLSHVYIRILLLVL